MMRVGIGLAAVLSTGLALLPALAGVEPDTRGAVRKALPLLEKGSGGYIAQRGCFSCHHQALPVFALQAARQRGFAVDLKNLQAQVKHTETDLRGNIGAYRSGQGQGGGAVRAGYALWTLSAGEWKPDETTAAVSAFLLQRDANLGYWRTGAQRPPSEASSFTSTFVALQALQGYPAGLDPEAVRQRTARTLEWLRTTPAKDTEDRVFRLWSLKLAGASAEEVRQAAKELVDTQQADGGWAQTGELKSDAYATGSALVALRETGALAATDESFRKGAAFLVGTQLPDGSWHVVTRSKPSSPTSRAAFHTPKTSGSVARPRPGQHGHCVSVDEILTLSGIIEQAGPRVPAR